MGIPFPPICGAMDVDCTAVVAQADPKTCGVFWRGPNEKEFVFYTLKQWAAIEGALLDAVTQRNLSESFAKRAQLHGSDGTAFVFVWVRAGPIPYFPMTYATVTHWVYTHPKRRSERLKTVKAKRQKSCDVEQ